MFRLNVLNEKTNIFLNKQEAIMNSPYGLQILQNSQYRNVVVENDQNDLLEGSQSENIIKAGAGNDWIYTSGNEDLVYANAGDDRIIIKSYSGVFHGGEGHDFMELDNNSYKSNFQSKYYLNSGYGNDTINFSNTNNQKLIVTLLGAEGNDAITVNVAGNIKIKGGFGDDVITTNRGFNKIWGGAGEDTIYGGKDQDIIFGNNGQDKIWGGAGADTIDGSAGDDIIYGGGDNDILRGSIGNDTLFGGSGSNIMNGGAGDDLLVTQNGQNQMHGGKGKDTFERSTEGHMLVADFNRYEDLILLKGTSSDYSLIEDEKSTMIMQDNTRVGVIDDNLNLDINDQYFRFID